MIIRIKKIHIFLGAFIVAALCFVITVINEPISKNVSAEIEVKVPIVMYHHITENKAKTGKYVIHTEELENDMKYLSSKGYTAVFVADLINYVSGKISLPDKVIMITFDDGFKSVYKLAMPILEKYNMKAVLAVVGSITQEYTDNNNTNINYSYLTWSELSELNQSGIFEIQNHTYNMHTLLLCNNGRNGISKKKGESDIEYKNVIVADLQKMQNELYEKSGIVATAIAYPYGAYSKETLNIIKELGFKSNFLCEEKIPTIIRGDENSLYNLGRFNRASGIKTEDFFKEMNVF